MSENSESIEINLPNHMRSADAINQHLKKLLLESEKTVEEQSKHYQSILESHKNRISRLSERSMTLESKEEELETQILELETELKNKNSEIKDIKMNNKFLCEQNEQNKSIYEKQIYFLEKQMEELKSALEQPHEIDVSEFVNGKKEINLEKLKKFVSSFASLNGILRIQISNLEKLVKKSQQPLTFYPLKYRERKKEMKYRSSSVDYGQDSTDSDNKAWNNLIEGHNKERENLMSQINDLKKELYENESRLAENRNDKKDDSLLLVNNELTEKVKELEESLKLKQIELKKANEEIKNLTSANASLASNAKKSTLEYDQLHFKFENLQEAHGKLLELQEYKNCPRSTIKPEEHIAPIAPVKKEVQKPRKSTNTKPCPNCGDHFNYDELQQHFDKCINDEN